MNNETSRKISEAIDAAAIVLASQTAAIATALIRNGVIKADDIQRALDERKSNLPEVLGFRAHEEARRVFADALRRAGQTPAAH